MAQQQQHHQWLLFKQQELQDLTQCCGATQALMRHMVTLLPRVCHAMAHCQHRDGRQCRCEASYAYDGPSLQVAPLLQQLHQASLRAHYEPRVDNGVYTMGIVRVAW